MLTTGNLTNAFAQSVSVGALALMASSAGVAATALLAVVLAVAYLSHTGTLAILFVATLLTAGLFRWRGGAALRSPAGAIATLAAALLAIVLYYAHFLDTYRAELGRIGQETASAAPDVGGRTIADRLRLVPYYLGVYIGVPVLLFAGLGAAVLVRTGVADRQTLALAGWILSCAVFLVIGVLTPVDMRHYLAASPAIAIAAGYGAAWAWRDAWPRHRTLCASPPPLSSRPPSPPRSTTGGVRWDDRETADGSITKITKVQRSRRNIAL